VKIEHPEGGHAPGNDLQAMLDKQVSITPLQLDMTCAAVIGELQAVFG
jgi:5'-nucleotidase